LKKADMLFVPKPEKYEFDWSVLDREHTWIRDMRDVPQDPVFHAEGDVWIHTRMVAEALVKLNEWQALPENERAILFWAVLLHDVAKSFSTVVSESGRVSAPGHAPKGARLARQILWKGIPEPLPFAERETIVALVKYHGAPLWNMGRENSLKILLKAGLHCNLHHLALLAEADVRGRICPDMNELLERIEFFREYAKEANTYTQSYPFANDLTRFTFFQKEDSYPDYVPFDDTWGEVILMSGLPGAGKDTWIQKNGGGLPVISLDEIRREKKIKPTDKQGDRHSGRQRKSQGIPAGKTAFHLECNQYYAPDAKAFGGAVYYLQSAGENRLRRISLSTITLSESGHGRLMFRWR
jgi:hypothetical protein